jgi:hypothetical protein
MAGGISGVSESVDEAYLNYREHQNISMYLSRGIAKELPFVEESRGTR